MQPFPNTAPGWILFAVALVIVGSIFWTVIRPLLRKPSDRTADQDDLVYHGPKYHEPMHDGEVFGRHRHPAPRHIPTQRSNSLERKKVG